MWCTLIQRLLFETFISLKRLKKCHSLFGLIFLCSVVPGGYSRLHYLTHSLRLTQTHTHTKNRFSTESIVYRLSRIVCLMYISVSLGEKNECITSPPLVVIISNLNVVG